MASSSRKRVKSCCACLGILCILALLSAIPLVHMFNSDLAKIGRKVADASDWQRRPQSYYWDTNGSQIFLTFHEEPDGSYTPQLGRLEDKTRQITPLPPQSAQSVVFTRNLEAVQPSPNGKWLLSRPWRADHFTAIETTKRRTLRWEDASGIFGIR